LARHYTFEPRDIDLILARLRWTPTGYKLADGPASAPLSGPAACDQADALFLDLVDAFAAAGRPVSDATGHNYAPNLFAADPRGKAMTKAGFLHAMNRAFAAGIIRVETEGPPSRPRKRLVRCAV
jgi:hypothetical protein